MARTRDSSAQKNSAQHVNVGQTLKTAMENIPEAKRTHDTVSNNNTAESEQPTPPKRPWKAAKEKSPAPVAASSDQSAQPPAWRSTRNTTKAPAVGQKRKRRTKAQIAADNAAVEAEKARLEGLAEELAKDKQKTIAQMDLEEDMDRMETEARTICKFSDLDRGFELSGEVCWDDFQALQKSNKALQKELSALKAQVSGGAKKSVGGKKATKHVTFAAASGLRSDWKGSRSGSMVPKKHSHIEIVSGGLGDLDIEDTNTFVKRAVSSRKAVTEEELAEASKSATRDTSRKNELVAIIPDKSDSEEDFSPQPQLCTPPKPSAKKVIAKKTRVVQTKIKSKPKASLPTPTKAVASTKTRPLNANKLHWRRTILPTVYDKFFTSKEPFSQFFKGSDAFIALLQAVISEVFPATNYRASATDALHHLAYNRINKKCSHIGSGAIEAVKQHINTFNGGKEVQEWTCWAIRGDGPLFFRIPTPLNSPSDRTDPRYKHPEGRLLSQFIINLAAPYLRLKKGSISENGYPKGLFALIMAALERAVRSLMKPLDQIKEFSNEYWGSKVTVYHSSLRAIEEARWKEIFDACGSSKGTEDDSEDETNQADLSLLDNNRAFLFDFASPAKLRA